MVRKHPCDRDLALWVGVRGAASKKGFYGGGAGCSPAKFWCLKFRVQFLVRQNQFLENGTFQDKW